MDASVSSAVDELIEEVSTAGVQIDLRDPVYRDGVLETTQGGVVSATGLRIQGKKIEYTSKETKDQHIVTIKAEGALLMEFKEHVFVGDKLEYDFVTKTGVIENGRTAIEPWFIGGKRIEIDSEGTYTIYDGFLTTAESDDPEWQIAFEKTTLDPCNNFAASQIRFRFYQAPVAYLPRIKANLDDIVDMPIRIYTGWEGKWGPRVTLVYELYALNRWKNFLRFDYRLKNGPGIGLETHYRSEDHKERLDMINYVARDASGFDLSEHVRYRLQGFYSNLLYEDKISVNLTYDKLSDQEMPSDYSYSSIDLKYAGMTRLQARWQEQKWIANFLTTVRVNDFQTLKQELPSWEVNWKPFEISSTGIISDNRLKTSYLDFKFAKEVKHADDYHAIRLEYFQRFYRRMSVGPINIVPEAAILSIFYNPPRHGPHRWLNMGLFTLEGTAPLYRNYQTFKHTFIPYVRYNYYTAPTVSHDDHYIFDINDGWCRLNMVRLGTKQIFYWHSNSACWEKYATVDLYMNAFCDTPTQPVAIPRLYAKSIWQLSPYVRSSIDTAWDFQFQRLGYINIRTDWTVTDGFAFGTEFRHRDASTWRKSNTENFMLESCRSTEALLHSPLSDRRDTLLLRFFYRFSPKWTSEFQIRHGWNRKKEPSYTEYEWDLIGTIQRAWQLRFSYQHKENDRHRFAVYLNFGLKRPVQSSTEHHIPTLSF